MNIDWTFPEPHRGPPNELNQHDGPGQAHPKGEE